MKSTSMIKWFLVGIYFTTTQTLALTLSSPDFTANGPIPSQYTCTSKNESPTLTWQGAPNKTQTYVLMLDDPDAPSGIWNHWIVFNIPPNTLSLARNLSTFPLGTQLGKNSWHHQRYDGPCPPSGMHHYYFKLYALDNSLNLTSGASKSEVITAMQNHVLATASLMGTYSK